MAIDASSFKEFSVNEAGREACIAEKSIRFTPKPYATLHYVYAGQGTFVYKGKAHALHRDEIFLIPAGEEASYASSATDPWSYYWIGVGGSRSEEILAQAGLTSEHPVFPDKAKSLKRYFEAIYDSYFANGSLGIETMAKAMGLFAEMGKGADRPLTRSEKGHIQAAKAFIRNNYQFPITILDVARSVGVSPNYLANLFAEEGETSPKRYLTCTRMDVAGNLLLHSSAPVAEIGRAVGYPNPLHFSKAFNAFYGVSPLHYRNQGGK